MTETAFVEKLKRSFIEKGFLARQEIGVGYGVADLVLIRKSKINARHVALRQSYRQTSPLLKEEYFRALSFIPDKPNKTSIETLVKRTHLSRSFLKYSILRTLQKRGYIKSDGKSYYFKINGWVPLASELIAVEAKMRDWKRGLVQANRYKVFANRVYLAVPSSIQHLVDRQMLRKHRIGLISFDTKNNTKRILFPAESNKFIIPSKSNFAAEHFWNKSGMREVCSPA
jgi:hypothetical protein